MKDKILLYLSLLSLCVLCFVAGAATMHFKPGYIQSIKNGFIGAEGLNDAKQEPVVKTGRRKVFIPYKPLPAVVSGVEGKYYSGYTLINTSFSATVQLIDDHGKVLHSWNAPFKKAWPKEPAFVVMRNNLKDIETAYVFSNGDLIVQYTGVASTPYGYGIAVYDKNSRLLWKLSENAHHDIYISPDETAIYGITQTFAKYPLNGYEYLYYPQLIDSIVKLSRNGEVLDRISITDAFKDTEHAKLFKQLSDNHVKRWNSEVWDAFHTNSIQVLEKDFAPRFSGFSAGDYLISLRNTTIVAVIDHNTKKVKWSMCCQWGGQHSPRFTRNGTIMLFDNEGVEKAGTRYSRILEIEPVTKKVSLVYEGNENNPFYTETRGRLQPLPNGNVLIVDSNNSRVFEINKKGEVVWNYKTLDTDKRFNAGISYVQRYSKDQLKFLNEKTIQPATRIEKKN